MKIGEWVKDSRELVGSGIEGAGSAMREALQDEKVSSAVGRTLRDSWQGAAVGAAVGIAATLLATERRRSRSSAAAGFLIGAVAGLGIAALWQGREVVGAMTHGAARNMGTVRDAHWLDKHPIPYG